MATTHAYCYLNVFFHMFLVGHVDLNFWFLTDLVIFFKIFRVIIINASTKNLGLATPLYIVIVNYLV
jgi:hypothetical protein